MPNNLKEKRTAKTKKQNVSNFQNEAQMLTADNLFKKEVGNDNCRKLDDNESY